MDSLVIIVILSSAILHAVWNAIIKSGPDKLMETSMKTCGGGIVAFLILPFIPFPTPNAWICLGLTTSIHLFYYLFIAIAYKGSDMSYAYTIMRGSAPLLTALVSVFVLRENLPFSSWSGVIAISFGVLILAFDAIRQGGFSFTATALALGNAGIIMAYTLVDGHGARYAENALSYVCWVFFLNSFPITFFCLGTRGFSAWQRYLAGRWRFGLFGGICSLAAYSMVLWGMTRAPISTVAALRETSVVFGVLFAMIFLKEKVTPARVAAMFLVFAGSALIRL